MKTSFQSFIHTFFLFFLMIIIFSISCSIAINDKKSCASDDVKNACDAGYVCIGGECIQDPKNLSSTVSNENTNNIHARTSQKTIDVRGGILYHHKGFQVVIPSNTLGLDESVEFSVEEFGKSVPYGNTVPATTGFIFQPIPFTFSSTVSVLFSMDEKQISLVKERKLSMYHSINPGDNGWEILPSFIYTSSLAANVTETGMFFVGETLNQ